MNNIGRNVMFWMMILIVLMFVFNVFQGTQSRKDGSGEMLAYSDFMAEANSGRISDVTIRGQKVSGHYTGSGKEFEVLIPNEENVVDRLANSGVRITAEEPDPEKISALGL
ncbi:MAG TPA: ATP-dependent metallopeptidase FtsH/Yme1/Tma family protein, partial [Micavibrio sp.]